MPPSVENNQPRIEINMGDLIQNLAGFRGKVIIQTLFLRGIYKGSVIDNTTPEEISEWLKAIALINPSEVMIYTISRDTPDSGKLNKVPVNELKSIASKVESLGIKTQVSG